MADEIHAGALRAFVKPSLPAATTVAIPTARRLSMMDLVGSLSHGAVKLLPPRLRFAEEKFRALRRLYTCSSPAMMSDVQARTQGAEPPQSEELVNCEKTCTAMICAPFATPEKATPPPPPSQRRAARGGRRCLPRACHAGGAAAGSRGPRPVPSAAWSHSGRG